MSRKPEVHTRECEACGGRMKACYCAQEDMRVNAWLCECGNMCMAKVRERMFRLGDGHEDSKQYEE